MPRMRWAIAVLTILWGAMGISRAGDVVTWRNGGNALYPGATPPLEWSADKGVLWKTPMPAKSNASPLIVGDVIITQAEPDAVIGVDKASGKVLWTAANPIEDALSDEQKAQAELDKPKAAALRKELNPLEKRMRELRGAMRHDRQNRELRNEARELRTKIDDLKKRLRAVTMYAKPPTHDINGYSSTSPVSDGRFVYSVFGTGVVCCYDLQGNRKWVRRYESPSHVWGFSTSPVLVDGKVIVHIETLMALDASTGEAAWKANLPWSWGTSAIASVGGQSVAVTPKGDFVRISDGKALAGKTFKMPWGSPVVVDGTIYAIDEDGCWALEVPKTMAENLSPKVLWRKPPPVKDRYYATTLVHEGLLYNIAGNSKKTLAVLDAKTGDTVYSQQLDLADRRQYATISCAGGHLFMHSEGGDSVVFKPGRAYEVVARNPLEEFRSTPTFQGARMYVRTNKHLYCFGK